jgi:hypothetical protein
MPNDPKVRMVAVRIMPGTFIAPMLSLMAFIVKNL